MQVFIFVLIILVCVFLALIVLIQNPKGGGLDSSFQSVNQIGGVKRTGDFLEKSTWTLAIGLFVLCLVSAGIQERGDVVINLSTVSGIRTDSAKRRDQGAAEMPASGTRICRVLRIICL